MTVSIWGTVILVKNKTKKWHFFIFAVAFGLVKHDTILTKIIRLQRFVFFIILALFKIYLQIDRVLTSQFSEVNLAEAQSL